MITFDKVISGMIADAWYSVMEYHLRMGTKDNQGNSVNSIERAMNKIEEYFGDENQSKLSMKLQRAFQESFLNTH